MPTLITAGDGTNGVVVTSGNDNTLTIQTGAAGAKVNAISLASDGGATFLKTTGGILTLSTAQATTSGTSIDFTGIPSWAKRITMMLNGVSTSGVNTLLAQIGSGSIQTTGYLTAGGVFGGTTSVSTAAFPLSASVAAADTYMGHLILTLVGSNTWVGSSLIANNNAGSGGIRFGGGNVTLSGALDRIRLTTSGGTDTFDAGSVNIMYEG